PRSAVAEAGRFWSSDPHAKKVLLCVWWCTSGPIHWELLPPNTTVTVDLYCRQLDTLAEKLRGKMDRVFFLHDSACPHVAKSTRQEIQDPVGRRSQPPVFSGHGFD
ncbi:transposase, partial [Oesophagostomum dentatum]